MDVHKRYLLAILDGKGKLKNSIHNESKLGSFFDRKE
jgi:hypothetical protein